MKLKAEFDLKAVFEIIEAHLKSIGYELDLDEDMEAEGVEAENFKIFSAVLPIGGGASGSNGKIETEVKSNAGTNS